MNSESCTIFDCEFNDYVKGIVKNHTVYVIDKDGNLAPAKDYVCEHVDFDMVQFFIGHYDDSEEIELKTSKGTAKWGYFELSTGKVIVPPTYDYAYPFYGDRAKVQKNGKFGFIDPDGEVVVEIIWDDTANAFRYDFCWVKEGNKFGYIDKCGTVVFPPQFEKVKQFQKVGENLFGALVKKNGKYGFVNESGHYIVEPIFEHAKKFWIIGYIPFKSLAPVRLSGKWGFIDNRGNIVLPCQFDNVGEEGDFTTKEILQKESVLFGREHVYFYTVKKDGHWGLMNSEFEVMMPKAEKRFVEFRDRKIYIKHGKITCIRNLRNEKDE